MGQRRPDADHGNDTQQSPDEIGRVTVHLFLQAAFGLHDQPGATQLRISQQQRKAAKQWERPQPVEWATGIHVVLHRNAIEERPKGDALGEGGDDRAANERLVPPVAAALAGLEAELEGHAAEDQAQQHQYQRQVEGAEDHRVGQGEGTEQARTAQHQPGLVAVPHWCDGIHHDVAFFLVLDRQEENADAEVEAVHDDVHHDPENNDQCPDQRDIDAHSSRSSSSNRILHAQ
ncbi:hypothetical protein D3C72_975920 [compost metagenome]